MEKGVFILSAGANASGKTSIIKPKHIDERITHYLDPDRPELLLPESLRDIEPELIVFGDVKEILTEGTFTAFREALLESASKFTKGEFTTKCTKDWLNSAEFRQEGIATESTLSGAYNDRNSFAVAKSHDMRTELYYVYVPLDVPCQGSNFYFTSQMRSVRLQNGLAAFARKGMKWLFIFVVSHLGKLSQFAKFAFQ